MIHLATSNTGDRGVRPFRRVAINVMQSEAKHLHTSQRGKIGILRYAQEGPTILSRTRENAAVKVRVEKVLHPTREGGPAGSG